MKTALWILAAVLAIGTPPLVADERPTAEHLLAAFEKSVEKLSRVRIEWKFSGREGGNDAEMTIFRDGPRWKFDRFLIPKGNRPGSSRKREQTLIGDEIVRVSLKYDPLDDMPRVMEMGMMAIREHVATRSWPQLLSASVLFGRINGDAGYPLWTVMREAGSLELLPQTEVVDGAETYVLKSVGKYGEHRVWLDAASGGLPRRIEIDKQSGNLLNDEQLGSTPFPKETPLDPNRRIQIPVRRPRSAASTRIDKIHIENKDGLFVITGFEEEGRTTFSDGKNPEPNDGTTPPPKRGHKFRVDIDPKDFPEDAFRFAIAIPNGTPVSVLDNYPLEYQGPVKTEHEWVDGKIQNRLQK